MYFGRCAIYLAVIGVLSQLTALLPRRWFHADRFPFRAYGWEKGGEIYRRVGITHWKDRVPDMSRYLPFLTSKTMSAGVSAAQAERLVQETCVAECVHVVLSLMTLYCLRLWPGAGGVVLTVLYILAGHVPFIMIQRYNRPRFMMIAERLRRREAKK